MAGVVVSSPVDTVFGVSRITNVGEQTQLVRQRIQTLITGVITTRDPVLGLTTYPGLIQTQTTITQTIVQDVTSVSLVRYPLTTIYTSSTSLLPTTSATSLLSSTTTAITTSLPSTTIPTTTSLPSTTLPTTTSTPSTTSSSSVAVVTATTTITPLDPITTTLPVPSLSSSSSSSSSASLSPNNGGSTGGSGSSLSTGAIVGIAVGGIAVAAILGFLLWLLCFRKRPSDSDSYYGAEKLPDDMFDPGYNSSYNRNGSFSGGYAAASGAVTGAAAGVLAGSAAQRYSNHAGYGAGQSTLPSIPRQPVPQGGGGYGAALPIASKFSRDNLQQDARPQHAQVAQLQQQAAVQRSQSIASIPAQDLGKGAGYASPFPALGPDGKPVDQRTWRERQSLVKNGFKPSDILTPEQQQRRDAQLPVLRQQQQVQRLSALHEVPSRSSFVSSSAEGGLPYLKATSPEARLPLPGQEVDPSMSMGAALAPAPQRQSTPAQQNPLPPIPTEHPAPAPAQHLSPQLPSSPAPSSSVAPSYHTMPHEAPEVQPQPQQQYTVKQSGAPYSHSPVRASFAGPPSQGVAPYATPSQMLDQRLSGQGAYPGVGHGYRPTQSMGPMQYGQRNSSVADDIYGGLTSGLSNRDMARLGMSHR